MGEFEYFGRAGNHVCLVRKVREGFRPKPFAVFFNSSNLAGSFKWGECGFIQGYLSCLSNKKIIIIKQNLD